MPRASKGTVSVQSIRGRLRLYWRFQGRQVFLALGYPDKPQYRQVARLKAAQIEGDILYGTYDPTLARYRGEIPEEPDVLGVREIWAKFVEYKRFQVKASTMRSQYALWTRAVEQFPTNSPTEAAKIRDWLLQNRSIGSTKRILVALNDCFNWAVASRLAESNPFTGLAKGLIVPRQKSKSDDIDPFTDLERDRIIGIFRSNKYYSHYALLVQFLFSTGCRPGEALALQWRHIHQNFQKITFEQVLSDTEDGLRVVTGLKTEEKRDFPCNELLRELLKKIQRSAPTTDPDDLIFCSPRNRSHIDWHNFTNRAWKTVLKTAGIRYRNPYQMRHTFITLALRAGMEPTDVAKICGNSAEIIYRHYAGARQSIEVPAF